MRKRKWNVKNFLITFLIASVLESGMVVMAESTDKVAVGAMPIQVDFYYKNEDDSTVKNANISQEEAMAAQKERNTSVSVLGYIPDKITVGYNKSKLNDIVKEKNLENYYTILKNDIVSKGHDAGYGAWETADIIIVEIDINDNKTVQTAIEEYESVDYVEYAEPDYNIKACVNPDFKVMGIMPIYKEDSIVLGGVHQNAGSYTKYRWEYCKIGENTWHLISDWNSSEWCTWYPDANDSYAVVCKASYHGNETVDSQSVWYISRPQMQKKLTGKCAVPTSDGLLFGCTSNVTKNDTDYYTSCYIWSHEKQAWIAQASYRASDCAWFRVSSLPKGTYMMYTCTEKRMPNGEKRKLSCDYYLFSNNS